MTDDRTRTLPPDRMEALPIGGRQYVVRSTRYFWTARNRQSVNRYTFATVFDSRQEAEAFIASRQESTS